MASTAELEAEILADLEENPDAYTAPVNDVITIDPETKTINLPSSEVLFGTEEEHGVERKYFKCPRIVGDNIDLFTHQIYISYMAVKDKNATFIPDSIPQSYWCDDVALDETGNYITFSWLLSGNVLASRGFVGFAVIAKSVEGDILKTRWKTAPAVGTVLMTLPDAGEGIAELYPDIITQLLDRMDAVEEIATVELDESLSDNTKAAPAGMVGELKVDLSKLSEEKIDNPSTGSVGQILEIESVDEKGKPKTYKAVDKPTSSGEVSDEQISSAVSEYMANNPIEESDPTVPEWAKSPQKPTYTASEVGADAAGTAESKVSAHNVSDTAHNDIRLLVQGLTERLNALADSDDTTLDQMSEIVSYIKYNRSLINGIDTNKVDVSDIINNLTSNNTNKPLSAKQGRELKSLIDAIIVPTKLSELKNDSGYAKTTDIPDKLPNPQKLTFAGAITAEYDGSGAVTVTIPESSGGSGVSDEKIAEAVGTYMETHPIEETDPTVPEWAKQPTKPKYTASEVGAIPDTTKIPSKTSDLQNDRGFLTEHQDLSGYATKGEIPKTASDVGADASGTAESKVSAHNTATDAHNDIRLLVQGLTDRLNALADSDDETLDQMSEVVAYIKSNKSLIDAITTGKVSVSDIVNNLTTNVSNKPLSAAQGVILKTMIDEITIPEKLPNPYSLTFTGAVAGIYNGSEALTINIPSGGDGSTYYVTPEQFGAIGDGVTDDSEAFRQAIETEKPIVCTYGKKYNCITEIVTEKTTINIIGNRCMLKNFHLKINVNSGETSWINAYPVPNSTIQDVNFNGTDKPEYCIKTGIPIKFLNCKWDFYDIMVKNFGSYMDYIVFENCAFKNHSGTHYAIDLAYLGDQHVFRECDFGGTGENRKFVSLSGCQSATIINCLFAGDHIIYSSNVVFIGCHMEGVSSITVGGDKTWDTILHFIDCYFWDMYTLSLAESSSFFDSCTFYISHQCIVGGRDYASYNQKNCKILCATTSDPNSYVNLDDLVNRKEFPERKALSNRCVYQSSKGAVAQGRNWPLNTGSYTYLFFPSTNPYSIDGWNFYYTKATLTFEISSDSSIVSFTGNSDFAGYYLWCYRTSPDGTIHRAIMPMHMDRFYDYGQYMNGIPWVEVDATPDPKTSLATFKNGIYYSGDGSCNGKNCMCINTSNGIISYISEDGVVHKNEYVDASEVMY